MEHTAVRNTPRYFTSFLTTGPITATSPHDDPHHLHYGIPLQTNYFLCFFLNLLSAFPEDIQTELIPHVFSYPAHELSPVPPFSNN